MTYKKTEGVQILLHSNHSSILLSYSSCITYVWVASHCPSSVCVDCSFHSLLVRPWFCLPCGSLGSTKSDAHQLVSQAVRLFHFIYFFWEIFYIVICVLGKFPWKLFDTIFLWKFCSSKNLGPRNNSSVYMDKSHLQNKCSILFFLNKDGYYVCMCMHSDGAWLHADHKAAKSHTLGSEQHTRTLSHILFTSIRHLQNTEPPPYSRIKYQLYIIRRGSSKAKCWNRIQYQYNMYYNL